MQPSDSPPRVHGGVLTKDPSGRLLSILVRCPGVDRVTPAIAQEVWSSARDRKQRRWDPLDAARLERGLVIEWRRDRVIACEHCATSLGAYVAYRSDTEYGIVADTARSARAASLTPAPRSRFRLEGRAAERAGKTTAVFHCAKCKRDIRRNLATLGKQLFTGPISVAI
jgi:hypothetical protein